MKTYSKVIPILLLLAQQTFASTFFTVAISPSGTNTVFTVMGKPATREMIQGAASRVAALDPNQTVLILVDIRTPAEQLLSVLKLIKDSGLQKVCILPKQERTDLDVLSLNFLPGTNRFNQSYHGSLDDLLEDISPLPNEPKEK